MDGEGEMKEQGYLGSNIHLIYGLGTASSMGLLICRKQVLHNILEALLPPIRTSIAVWYVALSQD